MSTTFETAKVGDRVWSVENGWGVIHSLGVCVSYPVRVAFPDQKWASYTLEGKRLYIHKHQTLLWDEVKIEAPQKPRPDLEVDTKVLVWVDEATKFRRHFKGWSNTGFPIMAYDDGATSWSANSFSYWPHWELAE